MQRVDHRALVLALNLSTDLNLLRPSGGTPGALDAAVGTGSFEAAQHVATDTRFAAPGRLDACAIASATRLVEAVSLRG